MNKKKILEEHIEFKKTSVNSVEKLKDIRRYIGRFLNSNKKPLNKFEEKDLTKFINSLSGKSINTINDIKVYLKVFIKWFFVDYSSRFRNLDRICKTHKSPKSHTPEQMLSLKDVEKLIKGEKDLMWRVYWLVFFYGGFRPSEACKLEWKDVSFESKGTIIKTFSKKNGKNFYKSLPKNAEEYLKQWKEKNDSNWVFPSPLVEGNHIKAKSVYFRLKKLSKRVLGNEVYPYTLRHSIATIKYNDDNLKDDDVANQMGHTKSMKDVYVNLDEEQIKLRARKIYIKPKKLTSKEKDEIKELKKQINKLKNFTKKGFLQIINIIKDVQDFSKIDVKQMEKSLEIEEKEIKRLMS